jgi:hypothetical protein
MQVFTNQEVFVAVFCPCAKRRQGAHFYPKQRGDSISGNNSSAATQIANLFGATVSSSIPTGETKPASQILFIVGADFKPNPFFPIDK